MSESKPRLYTGVYVYSIPSRDKAEKQSQKKSHNGKETTWHAYDVTLNYFLSYTVRQIYFYHESDFERYTLQVFEACNLNVLKYFLKKRDKYKNYVSIYIAVSHRGTNLTSELDIEYFL